MSDWKERLSQLGDLISDGVENLTDNFKQRLHYDEIIQVLPYAGFGNQTQIKVSGRALEYKGHIQTTQEENLWDNLANAYQRFESDEIPDLALQVQFQQQTTELITDQEGYYQAQIPLQTTPNTTELWHPYQVTIQQNNAEPKTFQGVVQIPAPNCDFGIISDIDDTIMVTNATSTLNMMRLTFLRSPASRLPFAGVSTFYQALATQGAKPRPIFYVSSSPWNLYDFLEEFMDLNKIPRGTLFLRDFGLQTLGASHHNHKAKYINEIMDTYPELAFILIGDSGQHDPEVYSEIVSQRPQQVKAIYIRDVSPEENRDTEVLSLAEKTREQHIDLCLVENTLEAARHAASKGYIRSEVLEQLQQELAQADKFPVESALGL